MKKYELTVEIHGYITADSMEAAEFQAFRILAFDQPGPLDEPIPFEATGGEIVALSEED